MAKSKENGIENLNQENVRKFYPPHGLVLSVFLMPLLCLFSSETLFETRVFAYFGAFLSIAGIYLVIHCRNLFKAAGTRLRPFEESSALVTSGAYRFSRNPIYLGMILVLMGLGFQLNDPLPFVVPLIFSIWIKVRFVLPEEEMMKQVYGDSFKNYMTKVRRWL